VSNKKRLAERNEKAARAAQMRRERDREQQRRARTIVTLIVAVVVVIVVVAAVAIIPRLGDAGPSPEGITAGPESVWVTDGAGDTVSRITPP